MDSIVDWISRSVKAWTDLKASGLFGCLPLCCTIFVHFRASFAFTHQTHKNGLKWHLKAQVPPDQDHELNLVQRWSLQKILFCIHTSFSAARNGILVRVTFWSSSEPPTAFIQNELIRLDLERWTRKIGSHWPSPPTRAKKCRFSSFECGLPPHLSHLDTMILHSTFIKDLENHSAYLRRWTCTESRWDLVSASDGSKTLDPSTLNELLVETTMGRRER